MLGNNRDPIRRAAGRMEAFGGERHPDWETARRTRRQPIRPPRSSNNSVGPDKCLAATCLNLQRPKPERKPDQVDQASGWKHPGEGVSCKDHVTAAVSPRMQVIQLSFRSPNAEYDGYGPLWPGSGQGRCRERPAFPSAWRAQSRPIRPGLPGACLHLPTEQYAAFVRASAGCARVPCKLVITPMMGRRGGRLRAATPHSRQPQPAHHSGFARRRTPPAASGRAARRWRAAAERAGRLVGLGGRLGRRRRPRGDAVQAAVGRPGRGRGGRAGGAALGRADRVGDRRPPEHRGGAPAVVVQHLNRLARLVGAAAVAGRRAARDRPQRESGARRRGRGGHRRLGLVRRLGRGHPRSARRARAPARRGRKGRGGLAPQAAPRRAHVRAAAAAAEEPAWPAALRGPAGVAARQLLHHHGIQARAVHLHGLPALHLLRAQRVGQHLDPPLRRRPLRRPGRLHLRGRVPRPRRRGLAGRGRLCRLLPRRFRVPLHVGLLPHLLRALGRGLVPLEQDRLRRHRRPHRRLLLPARVLRVLLPARVAVRLPGRHDDPGLPMRHLCRRRRLPAPLVAVVPHLPLPRPRLLRRRPADPHPRLPGLPRRRLDGHVVHGRHGPHVRRRRDAVRVQVAREAVAGEVRLRGAEPPDFPRARGGGGRGALVGDGGEREVEARSGGGEVGVRGVREERARSEEID